MFAAGGLLVAAILFGGTFYLRGIALDRCEAKIGEVRQLSAAFEQAAIEAAKRQQRAAEDAERRRLRLLREIEAHDKNAIPSPAIRDAHRLLCSQGAACADAAGNGDTGT